MIMTIILLIALSFSSATPDLTVGPVEQVATGFKFTEGPVWVPGEGLLFSDIPANIIYRKNKSIFRQPSGNSNGLILDQQGRLLAAEHGNRRVSRTEKDGTVTTVAERYQGKKLNSPNDLIVRSDGTIYFTDPPYGLQGRHAELDFNGVYRLDPEGELHVLVKDFIKPNGIALSPDEKTLYVADTEGHHIRSFAVADDGSISKGRILCEVPNPDGMAVDIKGSIWCTGKNGVYVFDASGAQLGLVKTPERPANCAFGGDDFKTLYITARTSVYKIQSKNEGLH